MTASTIPLDTESAIFDRLSFNTQPKSKEIKRDAAAIINQIFIP